MRSERRAARGALIPAVALGVLMGAGLLAPPLVAAAGIRLSTPSSSPASSSTAGARVTVAPAFAPGPSTYPVGELPPGTVLTVAVGLGSQDSPQLATYVEEEYSSGTREYGQFLSVGELSEHYGASPAAIAAADAYFTGEGLAVSVSPDHLLLFVTGPSGSVARAFGTTFVDYRTGAGSEFFDHPTAASLPGSIPWTGVLGLSNATPALPDVSVASAPPSSGPAAACGPTGVGLAPCQIWNAYDLNPLLANGTNGSGYRLAVVDAFSSDENELELASDLATFDTTFGLPLGNVNFVYPVPGTGQLNDSDVNPDWSAEDALDLEWSRAAAPGATIDFTFSPNPGVGLYEAVDWLVAHQAVNAISMSWGEPDVGVFNAFEPPVCTSACNATTDGSYAILAPVLEFAAAEGISVFAASGDCGAADGTSGVATNFPASDPYVTGVGGTVLNVSANGTYESEEGWSGNATGADAPGCDNQGGSGGGYAPFPRPAWQLGLAGTPTGRGVPDVALDAYTAATIQYHGTQVGVRGTSLATPIWAGISADLDQHAGEPLGFLDPALYRILTGPEYAADFHDIASGWNGYSAGPGWDPVTGIGTPIVAALADSMTPFAPGASGGLATSLNATPQAGAVPLTTQFRVNATGGSGDYAIEGVYFGDGTAGFAPGGVAEHTYTVAGAYAAQSYVVDSSGNVTASIPKLVLVGGGDVLAVALSASNATPAAGSAVTLTTTVVGGTSPYTFSYFFGDGTSYNGSSLASVTHTYAIAGSYCASVLVTDSGSPVDGGLSAAVAISVGGASAPACGSGLATLQIGGGPSVQQGAVPLAVDFSVNASGGAGAPYGFAWSFGDGSNGSGPNVSHTFTVAGTYHVELIVADVAGDLARRSWNLTVGASSSSFPAGLVIGISLGVGVAVGACAAVWVPRRAPWGGPPGPGPPPVPPPVSP